MIVLAEKKELALIAQYQETDSFLHAEFYVLQICMRTIHLQTFGYKSKKRQGNPQHICQKWTASLRCLFMKMRILTTLYVYQKIGARCIMCHASCAEQLHITPVRTGTIMKWNTHLNKTNQ